MTANISAAPYPAEPYFTLIVSFIRKKCAGSRLQRTKHAKERGIPFESICLDSRKAAQNAPAAWTNYALFYNGAYLSNEILSEKKFDALYEKIKEGEYGI